MQVDYERLASFRHRLRRFLAFSGAAAQAAGLTVAQHQALLGVKGQPGPARMTIGQLAEHLVVAPHTAGELVARLEADGLLKKVQDPADRRRTGLALTTRADDMLRDLSSTHLMEIREMAPELIATLGALLASDSEPGAKGDDRLEALAR